MTVDLLRRRALRRTALLGAALAAPAVHAATVAPGRVIVVGGGFAGASCAGALKQLWPALQVRLFEPRRHFASGPFCNAMVAGLRDLASVSVTPAGLAACGVDWQAQAVAEVDPVRLRVRDATGRWHAADRLVLAPGIGLDWDALPGLDAAGSERMPHGWLGDASLLALRRRFAALRDGATVLIGVPAHPYRCPPAPYERASLFAWALRGRRAKVLIADAKDDFTLRPQFQRAWARWPGTVEWIARAQGGEVHAVDTQRGEVRLGSGERLRPDLACIIPAQQAAALCHAAGLVDPSGWCPVLPDSFASTQHAGVHVLGDAAAAYPLPKSAMAARGSALLCAAAVCAALGQRPAPVPQALQSNCYSLVAPDAATALHGSYGVVGGRMSALWQAAAMPGEDEALLAQEARDWYAQAVRDSFATIARHR
ncbi:FCSD flavin-binding domain-containing protein [Pseudorhodoferax sp.]|uniref:FCSD flavin-binding domain-containing protein n=1 Tax=Pseudorhodoferax sp. TaxID=1993553 RepID=UPI002DD6AE84|nr:FCSD flavin-binding domain-containing protein [Pseudorhodoferax sp.]